MSLDGFFRIGETVTIGSHLFTAEEIKRFASRYDPQHFHVDEAAAEKSVFGGLCASGWHTCAVWMKLNLEHRKVMAAQPWDGPGRRPEFGPSPGVSDIKWLRPVFAGQTVTYTRCANGHRALSSLPGWRMLSLTATATAETGQRVLEFQNAVMIRAD